MISTIPGAGLAWLTNPVSFDDFVARYWARAPLRLARSQPGYYAGLLGPEEVDYALYAGCKNPGAVEELNDDQRPREFRDHIAAQQSFEEGKSLRLNAAQRFCPRVLGLCRSMEQDFSFPVNANLYLTPGANRAIGRHYDSHDVFVLQIAGKKKWRLFDSPAPLPLEYLPPLRCEPQERTKSARLEKMRDTSGKNRCALTEEFVLEPGDFLYVPRGFWHEAEAEPEQASCHLTIGAQVITYLDLLTVALGAAAGADAKLRAALPVGFATHTDAAATVRAQASAILERLPARLDPGAALAQVAETFLGSRSVPVHGLLKPAPAAPGISASMTVRIRAGLVCGVSRFEADGQARVRLAFGLQQMEMPADFEPACRFLARQHAFTPADLPGPITAAERISLAERLLADGLLVRVPEHAGTSANAAGAR